MLTLFTIPDASTIVSSTSDYSSTIFTEFLPIVYVVVGFVVGGLAIRWLIQALKGGIGRILGTRKGGRNRRR